MTIFIFLIGAAVPGAVQILGARTRAAAILACVAFVAWHAGPVALLVHLYSGIDAVLQEKAINERHSHDAAKTKPAEPKAQATDKPKQQRQPKPAKRPIVILSARRRFRDE